MKRLNLIMLVAVIICGCATSENNESSTNPFSERTVRILLAAPILKGENCALQAPPKEAVPYLLTHVKQFSFVYPTTIPVNYTGCQSIWWENGERSITLHFENGVPDRVEDYSENQLIGACKVDNTKERNYECPDHERFGYYEDIEPFRGKVPSNQDPRK